LRRFFLTTPLTPNISIKGEDAHHISRVLRLPVGEQIRVVAPDGQIGIAEITGIAAGIISLVLRQQIEEDTEPPVKVALGQGLPKGDKMEYIVQKAVELGVNQIYPMKVAHCVVQYDASKQIARRERWQKIAGEAAKQCGRSQVSVVAPIQSLAEIVSNQEEGTIVIMLYEGQTPLGLKQILTQFQGSSYLLLIGPEGGFSAEEVDFCQQRGAHIVTMGPRILRTETAAVAALSIVLYECGDLGTMET
jgi:16S rRNA (uracil1498-N3)-methyltransferase